MMLMNPAAQQYMPLLGNSIMMAVAQAPWMQVLQGLSGVQQAMQPVMHPPVMAAPVMQPSIYQHFAGIPSGNVEYKWPATAMNSKTGEAADGTPLSNGSWVFTGKQRENLVPTSNDSETRYFDHGTGKWEKL